MLYAMSMRTGQPIRQVIGCAPLPDGTLDEEWHAICQEPAAMAGEVDSRVEFFGRERSTQDQGKDEPCGTILTPSP